MAEVARVDLAGLRALAEKATPRTAADMAGRAVIAVPAISLRSDPRFDKIERDSAFVAACDPQTVLALINAVQAAQELVRRDVTLAQVAVNERVLVDALAPFERASPKERATGDSR